MKKTIFIFLCALLIPAVSNVALARVPPSYWMQMHIVEERVIADLLPTISDDEQMLQEIDAQMQGDGSFADIDYSDDFAFYQEQHIEHLRRLVMLSADYYRQADEALLADIATSIDWWLDFEGDIQEEWYSMVAYPEQLSRVLLFVGQPLMQANKELYEQLVFHLELPFAANAFGRYKWHDFEICYHSTLTAISARDREFSYKVRNELNPLVQEALNMRDPYNILPRVKPLSHYMRGTEAAFNNETTQRLERLNLLIQR